MPDVLMVNVTGSDYTPESDSHYPYNNTLYGEAVDADISNCPLLADGTPLQMAHEDRLISEVFENDSPLPTSTMLHQRYCATEQSVFSDQVELDSGDVVDVTEYDVVLVSFFWMYYGYIRYLGRTHPELGLVGIEEESLHHVMSCSAGLQAVHRDALDGLDGFIAVNEQYRSWIGAHVDNAVVQHLPVPEGLLHGVDKNGDGERGDDRTICVGIGSSNMDFANIYSNVLVVKRLRDAGYDVTAEIVGLKPFQQERFQPLVDKFDFLSSTGYLEEGYYGYLATMSLAVLLRRRITVGRAASEFAGLGVPCIGTPGNPHQRRCFPELCVSPHEVDRAAALAERLLSEEQFYDRTIQTARHELDSLRNLGPVRRTVNRLVESVA